jgi:deoxyribodipyrimidine photo-lyase
MNFNMKRAIVWFKTDLRLRDNLTLVQAIAHSDEIIPVYCFDEAHYRKTEFGFQKTGKFRVQFLLEALKDLDQNLRAIGSGLMIVKGKPELELARVAKLFGAQRVYAKKEVAYEELACQEKVELELAKAHCFLETFSTSTLFDAQDLPFALKDIPDTFTKFRTRIEKETLVRGVYDQPSRIQSPPLLAAQFPTVEELTSETIKKDHRLVFDFKGGETESWKRLQHYFFESKSLSHYKETRNALIGADASTKFSPWLALGCISARSIYAQIKRYENEVANNESSYWLFFELLWRDYFRFMMKKHHNRYFQKYGISEKQTDGRQHNETLFNKWKNGETENAFIDANMLELKLTGYMSNRGRQNVASYLCNDLKLDWRFGAAYFEQQLIDYDVCSNWGNWAYLAGVGNDPRGQRVFNIEKQANDYDKDKTYRNLWLKNN